MPKYRIFTVGHDQHFVGVPKIVECVDDNEAVDKAMQLMNGLDVEIWDHERMVTRLPNSSPNAEVRRR